MRRRDKDDLRQSNLPLTHSVSLMSTALHHSHKIHDQMLSNVNGCLVMATHVDVQRHLFLHFALHIPAANALDLNATARCLLDVLDVLSLRAHNKPSQLEGSQSGVVDDRHVAVESRGVSMVVVHILMQD